MSQKICNEKYRGDVNRYASDRVQNDSREVFESNNDSGKKAKEKRSKILIDSSFFDLIENKNLAQSVQRWILESGTIGKHWTACDENFKKWYGMNVP
jgi:hypothetical protein